MKVRHVVCRQKPSKLIIPVSFVGAPFRMVHCVNPECVFVHCPLTTASMLTNTTVAYERILLISVIGRVCVPFP